VKLEDAVRKTFARTFKELHDKLRDQVRGLDTGTLNWRPLPKANSVAVLVTHIVGSEVEMIRSIRSISTERDRDAEFRAEADADRLLEMIDAADKELDEQIAALTAADLTEPRSRADGRRPQPGLYWLVTNYGHSREHLAQIELTKQLYDSRT
jgi:DinB family protein